MGDGVAGCHFCQLEDGDIKSQLLVFGEKKTDEAGNPGRNPKGSDFIGEEISERRVRVAGVGYLISI